MAAACGSGVLEQERVERGTRILRVSYLLIWFAAGLCTSWAVVYWAGPFWSGLGGSGDGERLNIPAPAIPDGNEFLPI
jgi:hypothetical protein